jgi:hypothetical protein
MLIQKKGVVEVEEEGRVFIGLKVQLRYSPKQMPSKK